MRNDLQANEYINEVTTDVDEKKVVVKFQAGTEIKAILNKVAESNDKLKDWEFFDKVNNLPTD